MVGKEKNGVQVFGKDLITKLSSQALGAARKRVNYNFHSSMADNPHRFLNVMAQGTFVSPHRHLRPPKSESFVLLAGQVVFFVFDDEGRILQRVELGGAESGVGDVGIDIAPGVWHSLAVRSEIAVCFEVKPGPYRPEDDKEFAPWAPRENDEACSAYLQKLLDYDG